MGDSVIASTLLKSVDPFPSVRPAGAIIQAKYLLAHNAQARRLVPSSLPSGKVPLALAMSFRQCFRRSALHPGETRNDHAVFGRDLPGAGRPNRGKMWISRAGEGECGLNGQLQVIGGTLQLSAFWGTTRTFSIRARVP